MYRVTSQILITRTMMYYRPTLKIQIRAITRLPSLQKYKKVVERDTCPPPLPPPPPPPTDDRLFWGAMAALVVAGGFAYYAKQVPEVRDWLSLHAPWFDDIIAVMFEENMTRREFAEQTYESLKKYISDYSRPKPRKCSSDGELIPVEYEDEEEEEEVCDDTVVVSIMAASSIGTSRSAVPPSNVEKEKCEVLPPPVITRDICEIDRCFKDLQEEMLNNFYTAKEACAYYNRLVEEMMMNFSMKSLPELHAAMVERKELVRVSACNIGQANASYDDLCRYLECGVKAAPEDIAATKGFLKDNNDKVNAARMLFQWENDKAIAFDDQVARVEKLVSQYVDENQNLFPGLKYDQKKPTLTGDSDLLLYHALRYAKKLECELCDASEGMTERVDRALETLPQSDKELRARCKAMQYEVYRKRSEMDKEFKKRYDDQRAHNVKTLADALKKQLERHEETLKHKLEQKEIEITNKLDQLVAEKVAAEKKIFADQLAEMAAKLKIVEDKLNARLKAERETRRSQELWCAGASLLAATKKGDPFVKVNRELKAIEKARGDGDKLVNTVLKAIPESVRAKGVVPESVLKERFHKMERAARAVALVQSDGGPMPIYILSLVQSLMLFLRPSSIPQSEVDKPPKEPFKDLDTFDILQRAKYHIEKNNLPAAVRYVGALEGASKAAASTWFEEARSHLETRQAAEAILAHAAALGLQYI